MLSPNPASSEDRVCVYTTNKRDVNKIKYGLIKLTEETGDLTLRVTDFNILLELLIQQLNEIIRNGTQWHQ